MACALSSPNPSPPIRFCSKRHARGFRNDRRYTRSSTRTGGGGGRLPCLMSAAFGLASGRKPVWPNRRSTFRQGMSVSWHRFPCASGGDPFGRRGHGALSWVAVDESAPWWAAPTVAGGGRFCFYAGSSRASSVSMKRRKCGSLLFSSSGSTLPSRSNEWLPLW